MPRTTRFGVIGGGALGGLYGAMLAKAGFDVHFLLRSDAGHVRHHGWKVETPLGDFDVPVVNVHTSVETMPACDVTVVALKTTQNAILQSLLPKPTSQGGCVLVLQNGLDVERDAAVVVGPERVLGGCCFLCSNKVGPGHIRHLDHGRILLGDYQQSQHAISDRASAVFEDLVYAGIDAKLVSDLATARWKKLMWNIPFNGLSVVLNASTWELMESPEACGLARDLIEEVHQAAKACGSAISEKVIQTTLDVTREMVPYDSSMRLDYLNQRPMEIEAILGNPIRRAEACGCKMPRVEMLYHELLFLNRKSKFHRGAAQED
ncbi:MAG: putative 2-dehydropantoate 2-reductase [Rubripirellula sp.]